MPTKVVTLNANDTLANLQTAISQTEALGFELLTIARGVVDSQPSNTATFRRLAPGAQPGPLSLQEVSGASSLARQDADVNAGETSGKKLISYGAVLVGGKETNVAAYRAVSPRRRRRRGT